jgi:hypothetical protein
MTLVNIPLHFSRGCNELHFLYCAEMAYDTYRLNRHSRGQSRMEFKWKGCLMTQEIISMIPSHCVNVTKLVLNGKHRWKFLDSDLFPILDACPLLTDFKMCCCNGVTAAVFDKLSDACPLLHSVAISFVQSMDDQVVVRFVKTMPGLRKLSVRKFSGSLSLIAVANVCETCPLLEYFDVSDWQINRAQVMEFVLKKLPRLRTLVVNDSAGLSDEIIRNAKTEHGVRIEVVKSEVRCMFDHFF